MSAASPPPEGPQAASERAIERFVDAIWIEDGLSANTLAAYRADLTALARWLEERDSALLKATREELLGFIAARVEGGSRPRSTARQLSSFRRFFRYMIREGLLSGGPHRDAGVRARRAQQARERVGDRAAIALGVELRE